jgi:hypothetical protein
MAMQGYIVNGCHFDEDDLTGAFSELYFSLEGSEKHTKFWDLCSKYYPDEFKSARQDALDDGEDLMESPSYFSDRLDHAQGRELLSQLVSLESESLINENSLELQSKVNSESSNSHRRSEGIVISQKNNENSTDGYIVDGIHFESDDLAGAFTQLLSGARIGIREGVWRVVGAKHPSTLALAKDMAAKDNSDLDECPSYFADFLTYQEGKKLIDDLINLFIFSDLFVAQTLSKPMSSASRYTTSINSEGSDDKSRIQYDVEERSGSSSHNSDLISNNSDNVSRSELMLTAGKRLVCNECSCENEIGSKFCNKCGNSLSKKIDSMPYFLAVCENTEIFRKFNIKMSNTLKSGIGGATIGLYCSLFLSLFVSIIRFIFESKFGFFNIVFNVLNLQIIVVISLVFFLYGTVDAHLEKIKSGKNSS